MSVDSYRLSGGISAAEKANSRLPTPPDNGQPATDNPIFHAVPFAVKRKKYPGEDGKHLVEVVKYMVEVVDDILEVERHKVEVVADKVEVGKHMVDVMKHKVKVEKHKVDVVQNIVDVEKNRDTELENWREIPLPWRGGCAAAGVVRAF